MSLRDIIGIAAVLLIVAFAGTMTTLAIVWELDAKLDA